METINVTVWNEFRHEKEERIKKVYPEGMHTVIAKMLGRDKKYNITVSTLDEPECGLSKELLDKTDVLIWWAHCAHAEIPDEIAQRVVERVWDGMGFIALHSAHRSKPFVSLVGTSTRLKWRENDEKERLWVVNTAHPIVRGLPQYIELPQEETYGEPFSIPNPDDLIFISWFEGGEVFRSGCTFTRGRGKIFYFRPGHEEYPTFYREDISLVIKNAVDWAAPEKGAELVQGHVEPLEDVKDKFEGKSDEERLHLYINNGGIK